MKKSTALLATLVLSASLLLLAAASAATASQTVGQVQSSVSFRSLPSTSSTVYKYLKQGEQVVILEQVNAYWYKVQDVTGAIGYISADDKYIEIVASGSNGSSAANSATIAASVSFRTGPSTDNARIRYLSKGEKVTITGQPNSSWYAVTAADGTKGYVSSDPQYITVNGTITQPGGSTSGGSGAATGNATIVASVSFRTGPSTDNARIRYLSKGETVTITGQPNSYWYAVTAADGTKGYVSTDTQYIKVTGSIPSGNNTGNSSGGNASGGTGGSNSGSSDQAVIIERVIAAGMKYWGTPYEYGSDRNTTTTFDCSDFVRTAYREGANLTLPSDSRKQGDYVRNLGSVKTDWHQLKRGDLMFFMDSKGTSAAAYANVNKAAETITHVGIYLGDGQILHTYSTASGGVKTSVIAGSQWEYRFLFGGSVL
ncbi:C40 family peptidase [Paenibacillus rhizovicinus]|uniref:C40 family peptidase n=1 Tax=Paenibacillus rhizovicinus TaxID=2704463 RepID=A0A6C0NXG4_9BACL|nr:SH3 domain-containing C40 family peptidase [Paenibacillus rhizovicinus]QHW30878.1 C40 family peptidase [Paenibacillus rhizovicinus]